MRAYNRFRRPDDSAPLSRADEAQMAAGREIGAMARTLWPDGTLIQAQGYEDQVDATQQAVEAGAPVIFEGAFMADGFFCRCDVLVRTPEGWDIVEVKSSKSAKDVHDLDLAFQVMVLRACGLSVARAAVMHLDPKAVFQDQPLSPAELLTVTDRTKVVFEMVDKVAEKATAVAEALKSAIPPEPEVGGHCEKPKCGYAHLCRDLMPIDDIAFLPNVQAKKIIEFRRDGYHRFTDLPEDLKLGVNARRAIDVVRFNRPYISEKLPDWLSRIEFPVAFVDFEAMMPGIPILPGTGPYETLPFQWSAHILEHTEEEDPRHLEFLHESGGDPRAAFADSLWDLVGSVRSVVFYSSYERTQVRNLTKKGFGRAELVDVFERGFDLYEAVKDCLYYAEFRGSNSIKKVLPVVVPGLSYAGLAIADGNTAMVEYHRAAFGRVTEAERKEIYANLRAYCRMDTWAMVELYRALRKLGCGPLAV
ncbi:MAG: DUF2779 domain-containing protein [Fimbriimonadaceae bacterium]|nr:DUF2779 domain-containing protein [Fimbriimonadaceae bacterium]QYK55255.1 MAG: DUF2779 domain-containing protein [Fimbriimonadaceae bacterium]